MKEYEPEAGEQIQRACEGLALAAPAFMVFNGIRVEASEGERARDVFERWNKAWFEQRKAYELEGVRVVEAAAARLRALEHVAVAAMGAVAARGYGSPALTCQAYAGLADALAALDRVEKSG